MFQRIFDVQRRTAATTEPHNSGLGQHDNQRSVVTLTRRKGKGGIGSGNAKEVRKLLHQHLGGDGHGIPLGSFGKGNRLGSHRGTQGIIPPSRRGGVPSNGTDATDLNAQITGGGVLMRVREGDGVSLSSSWPISARHYYSIRRGHLLFVSILETTRATDIQNGGNQYEGTSSNYFHDCDN